MYQKLLHHICVCKIILQNDKLNQPEEKYIVKYKQVNKLKLTFNYKAFVETNMQTGLHLVTSQVSPAEFSPLKLKHFYTLFMFCTKNL